MSTSYSWEGKGRYGSFRLQRNVWVWEIPWEHVPYLSASAMVIHYKEALYRMHVPFYLYLLSAFGLCPSPNEYSWLALDLSSSWLLLVLITPSHPSRVAKISAVYSCYTYKCNAVKQYSLHGTFAGYIEGWSCLVSQSHEGSRKAIDGIVNA